MSGLSLTEERVEVAMEYFRRVDGGVPSLVDLCSEDVQFYFPKFGVGYGKTALLEGARGLSTLLLTIKHDFERMTIIPSGNFVIVEGFESGVTTEGTPWPNPRLSEGRFCNVFEFDQTLIKRVHVYVDPDFTSGHHDGFLWGHEVRMTRPS